MKEYSQLLGLLHKLHQKNSSLSKEQKYLHDRIRRFKEKYLDKPQSTSSNIFPDFDIDHNTTAEVLRIWLNMANTNEKIQRSRTRNTLHNYFQSTKKRKIHHLVETLSPNESIHENIPYFLPTLPLSTQVQASACNQPHETPIPQLCTPTKFQNIQSSTNTSLPNKSPPIVDTPTRILNAFSEYASSLHVKRKLF